MAPEMLAMPEQGRVTRTMPTKVADVWLYHAAGMMHYQLIPWTLLISHSCFLDTRLTPG
jgi:hypothetical protein